MFIGNLYFAQTKIGHINSTILLQNYPAVKTANGELDKFRASIDAQYNTMINDYQTKLKKYESESSTTSEAVNQSRTKEIQDYGMKINEYKENANKKIADKEQQLMNPLLEKAKSAVQKVAKQKGYQYVLDAANGSLLVAEGEDIYKDVAKELGF